MSRDRFNLSRWKGKFTGQEGFIVGASPSLYDLPTSIVHSPVHAINRGVFWANRPGKDPDFLTVLDQDWFQMSADSGDSRRKWEIASDFHRKGRLITPSWCPIGSRLPTLGPFIPPYKLFSTDLSRGMVTGWGGLIALQWLYHLGCNTITLVGMDGNPGHYGEDRPYPWGEKHRQMLELLVPGLRVRGVEVRHYGRNSAAQAGRTLQGSEGSTVVHSTVRSQVPRPEEPAPGPDGFSPWEWTDAQRRELRLAARRFNHQFCR